MNKISQQLNDYCAMTIARANSLIDVVEGRPIHPATLSALKQQGIINKDGSLPVLGQTLISLVRSIISQEFTPAPPSISVSVLEAVNLQKAARTETVKTITPRVGSSNLKCLVAVMRTPGAAVGSLTPVYGYSSLELLKEAGLVTFKESDHIRWASVLPTRKAIELVEWIAEYQEVLKEFPV